MKCEDYGEKSALCDPEIAAMRVDPDITGFDAASRFHGTGKILDDERGMKNTAMRKPLGSPDQKQLRLMNAARIIL